MMSTNSFSRGQMSGTTWAYLTVSVVVAGPGFRRTLRLTALTTSMGVHLLFSRVLKSKYRVVSPGARRFGKRSIFIICEHLQKPRNAGSRPETPFFTILLEFADFLDPRLLAGVLDFFDDGVSAADQLLAFFARLHPFIHRLADGRPGHLGAVLERRHRPVRRAV